MKRLAVIIFTVIILTSCTLSPVVQPDLVAQSLKGVTISDIRANPEKYTGQVLILGGIIVSIKTEETGTIIEVVSMVVSEGGYIKGYDPSAGRFLAFYPKERGLIDPVIYRLNSRITIAGRFMGMKTGQIEKMEYTYPEFEVLDLHLWREPQVYYYPDGYPYSYPYPYYPYPRPAFYFWFGPHWR